MKFISSDTKKSFFLIYSQFMERDQGWASKKTRKRKLPEEEDRGMLDLSFDELNQDLLEKVLAWLPTSSFCRLRSVCKRWSCVAESATFLLACSQIPSRDPWFFMVDPNLDQSIVFDTAEKNWKNLNHSLHLQQNPGHNSIPVAASGGLICFRTVSGEFVVCNPVTGAYRELPPVCTTNQSQTLDAIAMVSSANRSSYKLVLVCGDLPNLSAKVYDSGTNQWEEEITLIRNTNRNSLESESSGDETLYFLSKAGDVVATNMQRSPSKQYSSVITVKDGEEIIYFLSSTGTVVACNLAKKCFSEYPRLLPLYFEYSIDVIECRGEMLLVVLSELLESASLRVWRFSEENRLWHQIAVMPPAMSHEFYGGKADINCVGYGDQILICVNSTGTEFGSCFLCDLVTNGWIELPKCFVNGKPREFMSAFSFEPRIEACV
ncbi:PREDICTED: F-box only protein 13-like isoform X2 [Nelumbo nucifera]|uniref:F-box only protein 13-like isoform X2 n=1 Tax=Nelumbo nucifera TaxID=4432 RepID=A0A1U8A965_NELNU|nr:PREDICTED: F-box only protein 13-like isoform X2 [Nelumbo nucifera]